VDLILVLLLLAGGPCSAGAAAGPADGGGHEVRFSYSPQIGVESVAVAGSFNGWNKDALLLSDPDGDGRYEGSALLEPGRHLYKFVIDGRLWMKDPENSEAEPDGFTGFNSVVTAGSAPRRASVPVRSGDGDFAGEAVFHGDGIGYREWVPREGFAVLRLRTAAGDVEGVGFIARGRPAVRMKKVYTQGAHDVWEVLAAPFEARFEYCFELIDGGRSRVVGKDGLSETVLGDGGWFVFDKADAPRLDVPEWAMDAVFYQIFPERFFNGDPANDPEGAEPWGAAPKLFNHFGGDLEGVRQRLPYLKELGVTALYLNPIFEAASNHKYDTADYKKIDPRFGDDAVFERLAREARKAGIRIILDGVFNHSGDKHWAFQDLIEKGEGSKYADWYTVHSFPVRPSSPTYECWWGFGHLPKLNTSNPELRAHLLDAAGYWLEKGASGWRLDVPNEVPHGFWKEFRKVVRKKDPEAYIVGEIWQDGTPWLQGDQFDAVMNYVFRSAVLGYFGSGQLGLEDFDRQLAEQRHRYPRAALPAQFNLLGGHDTERIGTVFKDKAKLKLAVFFQMTYLGAPVVYYGDEAGLPGGKDPDCRRCFPWEEDEQDRELFEHYRKLIALRSSMAVLRRGTFEPVLVDEERDVYAYIRRFQGRTVLGLLHRGETPVELDIPLPKAMEGTRVLRDLYARKPYPVRGGRLKAVLGPNQGLLLTPSR